MKNLRILNVRTMYRESSKPAEFNLYLWHECINNYSQRRISTPRSTSKGFIYRYTYQRQTYVNMTILCYCVSLAMTMYLMPYPPVTYEYTVVLEIFITLGRTTTHEASEKEVDMTSKTYNKEAQCWLCLNNY